MIGLKHENRQALRRQFEFSNYFLSGLGAGLGWFLTRWSLSVSELGSPSVSVPIEFTNNNRPTIQVINHG